MRSEIAKRILDNTPDELKKKVSDFAKEQINNKAMTPKEKANELVEKFKAYAYVSFVEVYGYGEAELLQNAKQCAIICVDEIIESEVETIRYGIAYLQKRDYWQEVKEEITKL